MAVAGHKNGYLRYDSSTQYRDNSAGLDFEMKNALVRKFQLPSNRQGASQAEDPQPAQPQATDPNAPPAADVEVPEINTQFIDNLFHDSTFLNRFDASFDQTVPMELSAQTAQSTSRATARDASPQSPNLLELDLPDIPRPIPPHIL
jgi:hypothetical protein